jgi:hypothetical protein
VPSKPSQAMIYSTLRNAVVLTDRIVPPMPCCQTVHAIFAPDTRGRTQLEPTLTPEGSVCAGFAEPALPRRGQFVPLLAKRSVEVDNSEGQRSLDLPISHSLLNVNAFGRKRLWMA